MFNSKLAQISEEALPKLNTSITNGHVFAHRHEMEELIDQVFRCAAKSFPPQVQYKGSRRATVSDTYEHLKFKIQGGSHLFDITDTDVYYVKYMFQLDDLPYDRMPYERAKGTTGVYPIMIPFPNVRRGSLWRVENTTYTANPVLSDGVLSIEADKIFVSVTRSRFPVMDFSYQHRVTGMVDGVLEKGKVSYNSVLYSPIYNSSKESKTKLSTLVNYILAKHGLTGMFEKMFGFKPIVKEYTLGDEMEGYVVCHTLGRPPHRSLPSPKIAICIPEEHYDITIAKIVSGIFYIMDNEPYKVHIEEVDNPALWTRLIASFIKSDLNTPQKIMEVMTSHIVAVEGYMDELVKNRLASSDIHVDTTFELLLYLIKNYTRLTSKSEPNNVLNKRIESISYLLVPIIHGISKSLFDLNKLKDRNLDVVKVNRTFSKYLKRSLVKAISGQGMVKPVDCAVDNYMYSITRGIVPQAKAGKQRKRTGGLSESDRPHASVAVPFSVTAVTKSCPTPRESINPFLKYDDQGRFIVDEKRLEDLWKVEGRLNAK